MEHRARRAPIDDARGLQANERTLLAWARTGVALITFGFAIAQVSDWLHALEKPADRRAAVALGATFALLGAAAQAIGIARYVAVRRALLAHRPVPVGGVEVMALAVVIAVVGVFVTLYVFL